MDRWGDWLTVDSGFQRKDTGQSKWPSTCSPCRWPQFPLYMLRFFSFHTSFVSRLPSVSSHRSPERPPPKHSFPSTRCAWFPCPVSTFHLWTSISYTRLPQRHLFSSIALPKHSSYIHLSSYSTNTAWSMHQVSTYLNDDISCTISLT